MDYLSLFQGLWFSFVPSSIWIPLPGCEVNPASSQHQLLLCLAPFRVNPINLFEPFELPSFSWALFLFGNQSAVLCAQLLLSKSSRRLAGIDHCHNGLLSPVVIMSIPKLQRQAPDSLSLSVPLTLVFCVLRTLSTAPLNSISSITILNR